MILAFPLIGLKAGNRATEGDREMAGMEGSRLVIGLRRGLG